MAAGLLHPSRCRRRMPLARVIVGLGLREVLVGADPSKSHQPDGPFQIAEVLQNVRAGQMPCRSPCLIRTPLPFAAGVSPKYNNHDGEKSVAPVDRHAVIAAVIICHRVRRAAGLAKKPTSPQRADSLPERGIFFIGQCDKFIYSRICYRVISAVAVDGASECSNKGFAWPLARMLAKLRPALRRQLEHGRLRSNYLLWVDQPVTSSSSSPPP